MVSGRHDGGCHLVLTVEVLTLALTWQILESDDGETCWHIVKSPGRRSYVVFTAMAWMRSFDRKYSSEQRSESWAMQYLEIWKKSFHKRRLTAGMPAEVGLWCLETSEENASEGRKWSTMSHPTSESKSGKCHKIICDLQNYPLIPKMPPSGSRCSPNLCTKNTM